MSSLFVGLSAYAFIFASFVQNVISDEDSHDHDSHEDEHDHEECACIFEDYSLTMDCDDTDAMEDYYDLWFESSICNSTSNCGHNTTEEENCQKYYYFIQGHHDYCDDEGIPNYILVGFHKMEEGGCDDCEVDKQYNEDYDDCPDVDCTDDVDAREQVSILDDNDCIDDCNTTICIDAYQTIRAYHDGCEDGDDALVEEIETGIHEYEEVCEQHECNTATTTQPFECDEHTSDETYETTNDMSDNAHSITAMQIIICFNVFIVTHLLYYSGFYKMY